MKRIIVIGPGGAGKSTFATRLGKILKIDVIHLDSLYWNPGWVEPSKSEWKARVEQLISRDIWIIDGNYSGTLDARFQACDTVIFLDMRRIICLWRVLKRAVIYRGRNRPDMAEGCVERFDWKFAYWIWTYPKSTRPKIIRLLKDGADKKEVIWLRTPEEAEKFLAGFDVA